MCGSPGESFQDRREEGSKEGVEFPNNTRTVARDLIRYIAHVLAALVVDDAKQIVHIPPAVRQWWPGRKCAILDDQSQVRREIRKKKHNMLKTNLLLGDGVKP